MRILYLYDNSVQETGIDICIYWLLYLMRRSTYEFYMEFKNYNDVTFFYSWPPLISNFFVLDNKNIEVMISEQYCEETIKMTENLIIKMKNQSKM
jgi:hypothetical protein